MKHLDVKQIEEIIPHRHPFLLVDYIEDYEPGEFAVGYKCVTFREDFFRGHFPQEPVMPGCSDGRSAGTGGCGSHSFPGGHEGKNRLFRRHQQV